MSESVMNGLRPYDLWKRCAAFCMVCVGILAMFMGLDAGACDIGDESYQALCVRHWEQSPLAMLSYFIGHVWTDIFGDDIKNLRGLTYVIMCASVSVGCLYFFHRTRNGFVAAFFFFLCCVGARISEFNLYNWDTGSYLWDALCLVAMLAFTSRPRGYIAVILGALSALMALSRLPLAAETGVIAVAIILSCRRKGYGTGRIVGMLALALAGFMVTVLSVTTLMCGSFGTYLSAFTQDNIITGHSLSDINWFIWRFRALLMRQMLYVSPGIFCFLGALWIVKVRSYKWLYGVFFVLAMVFYCYDLYWEFRDFTSFIWPLVGCFLPFFLIPVLLLPASVAIGKIDGKSVPYLQIWLTLAFVVMLGFGSDTAMERMCGVFALPAAMGWIYPRLEGKFRDLMKIFFIFAAVVVVALFVTRLHFQHKELRYSIPGLPHNSEVRLPEGQYKFLSSTLPMVEACHDLGMKYTVIGDRYPFLYIMGDDNGLPLHYYDAHLRSDEAHPYAVAMSPYTSESDAVILAAWPRESLPAVDRLLEAQGYEVVVEETEVCVWVRPQWKSRFLQSISAETK